MDDKTQKTHSTYQLIGGEAAVQQLVDRFYDYMDTLPQAQEIRAMHEADLSQARRKLFMFLSGWLGGPDLFQQAFGHPRLRARHLPFPIDCAARDAWMLCMKKSLQDLALEDPMLERTLLHNLYKTADFMRNQDIQVL